MSHNVAVTLLYRSTGEKEWLNHPISVEEYFDLSEGNAPIDSVPRFESLSEYLPEKLRKHTATIKAVVAYKLLNRREEATETYWNNGKNRVIECRDYVEDKPELWELILTIEKPDDLLQSEEILRFGRDTNGAIRVICHSYTNYDKDGSDSVTVVPHGE